MPDQQWNRLLLVGPLFCILGCLCLANAQLDGSGLSVSGSGSGSGIIGEEFLEIIQDPGDLQLPAGGVATFSCTVRSSSVVTIDWFKNGSLLNDTLDSRIMITETDVSFNTVRSNLSINDLSLSDEGARFFCRARGFESSVDSSEGVLSILYPPSVSIEPRDLIVNRSDNAVLTCTGFGIPTPNLTWSNDSLQLFNMSDEIIISESVQINGTGFTVAVSVLTVVSVKKADEQSTFTCTGNNSVMDLIGSDEADEVMFTVQVPPNVRVVGDDNLLGIVGGITTLMFDISEASPEVDTNDISLLFDNGADVTDVIGNLDIANAVNPDVLSSTFVRYTFIVDDGDEGNYTLIAINAAGRGEDTVAVQVEAEPNILDPPQSQDIIQGDSVVFNCTSSSEPLHSITWMFNDTVIATYDAETNNGSISDPEKYSIVDPPSPIYGQLTVSNVVFADRGIYACNVSNVHESQDAYAELRVQVPPNATISSLMETSFVADTVSFYCLVEASPPPTIVWLVNGTELDVPAQGSVSLESAGLITLNSSLTLIDIDLDDIGRYSCNATNNLVEVRSDVSEELNLEVLHPPNVTALEPLEIVINQTQEAVFTCQAYGIPIPNITWVKVSDGSTVSNITGVTEITESVVPPTTLQSELRFVNGLNSDESAYLCRGSNGVTNLISSPEEDRVVLLVQVPVEIVNDPVDTVHFAGGNISLSCNASGVPLPTFSWHKSGDEYLSDEDPRIIITNRTLIDEVNEGLVESTITFLDLMLSDDADYHCSASNPGAHDTIFNVSSNQAHLSVQYPPNVTTLEPLEIVINQTQEAIFTCQAYGIPIPSITWVKVSDGSIVNNITGVTEITESIPFVNTSQSELRFVRGLNSDESIYTCVGFNNITNVIDSPERDNVTLLVQVPVEIVNDPVDTVHFAGGNISLSCNASGVPLPTFSWHKSGDEYLSDEDPRIIITNRTLIDEVNEGLVESTITFLDLMLSDDADYHCSASNPGAHDTIFNVSSNQSHLSVQYPPNVTTLEPLEIVINQTQEAIFTCQAYGIPIPSITWIKVSDGSIVNNITGVTEITESIPFVNTSQSELRFVRGLNSDESIYTCIGFNNITNVIDSPERDNVTLLVQVPVEIVNDPVDTVHFAGGNISLSCNASGVPLPTFSWHKSGDEYLSDEDPRIIITNRTLIDEVNEGLVESTITFLDLMLSDDADYHCSASNPGAHDTIFNVSSNQSHLSVQYPPNVTTLEPLEIVINQTQEAIFTCQAYGIPIPSITWIKVSDGSIVNNITGVTEITESIPIVNTSQSELRFVRGLNSDESIYTCIGFNNITNVIDSPERDNVTLLVQVPVEIVNDPVDTVHFAGGNISLSCNASGVPLPTFSWHKSGDEYLSDEDPRIIITNRTLIDEVNEGLVESTITFLDLMLSDDADYHCSASNPGAHDTIFNVSSNQSHLSVQYPPNVTTLEPLEIVINQTQEAIFTCQAYGIPIPSITWIKVSDGSIVNNITGVTEITESIPFVNTSQSELRFVRGLNSDESIYTCIGFNNITNVIDSPEQDNVTLLVQVPVEIVDDPVDTVHFAGGNISLSCNASGVPLPTFSWHKSGDEYLSDEDPNIIITNRTLIDEVNEGLVESTITFLDLVLSDDADYHCSASNPGAHDTIFNVSSNQSHLSVQYPPNVTTLEPLEIVINQTQEAIFTCQAYGIPIPSITWIKVSDGSIVNNITGVTEITESIPFVNTSQSELRFVRGLNSDESIYTCIGFNNITNVIDSPERDNVTLLVQVPVEIVNDPVDTVHFAGGNISLSCNASGVPLPTFSWHKSGDEYLSDEDPRIIITNRTLIDEVNEGLVESTITFLDLMLSDDADYHCSASNPGAHDTIFNVSSNQAHLFIQHPPNVTVNPELTIINESSIIRLDLTCWSFGIPPPLLTWTKIRTSEVLASEGQIQIAESQTVNSSTSILSLFVPRDPDESNYTCSAINNITNVLDTPESATAEVYVQDPARITTPPVGVTLPAGFPRYQMSCIAEGIPVPVITWLKDGVPLVDDSNVSDVRHIFIDPGTPTVFPMDVPEFGLIHSTLSLVDLILSDDAEYVCMAENTGAPGNVFRVYSDPVSINIEYPPLVAVDPTFLVLNQTDTATFTCTIFGIPTPSFKWTRGSDPTPLETIPGTLETTNVTNGNNITSVLTILSVKRTDMNGYTCTAENGINNLLESPETITAMLFVQEPSLFVINPEDVTNFTNGSAQFICSASGIPVPNILWFRNNTELRSGGRVSILETTVITPNDRNITSVLSIRDLQLSDTAFYHCVATNPGADDEVQFIDSSESAFLKVQYPPSVSVAPLLTIINETNTTLFTCTVFGIPVPNVTWVKHQDGFASNIVEGLDDPNITETISGYTLTSVLLFIEPMRTEEAVYECIGDNGVTNVIGVPESANVTLFVQVPAQFTTQPESQTNHTAGVATLSCIAAGLPPPTITWMKDGIVLDESNNRTSIETSSSFDDVFGETNSTLQIVDLVLSDAAVYHCVANNTGAPGITFTAFSRRVLLTVLYPPSVTVKPVSMIVNQTDRVPLNCTVFGLPRPEITWTDDRHNSVIRPLGGAISIIEEVLRENTYSSVLTFLSIVKVNESNYTCTAVNNVTNIIGAIEFGNSALIVQVPATVTSLVGPSISSRQGGTVIFSFILTEDSPPVLTQNIRWYFVGAGVVEDVTERDDTDIRFNISSDRHTLIITGVTPTEEGEYRLVATNEAGPGVGSIVLNIEGPPAIIIGAESKIRREGDEVTFTCFATGDPVPDVSWTFTRDSSVIPDSGTVNIEEDGEKYIIGDITEGSDFGSLTIFDITYNDTGEYECTVTNVNGTSKDSATLRVQVVPVITVHPISQPGIAGGNVTLTCTAVGFPLPIQGFGEIGDIVWLRNNVVVTPQLIPDNIIQRVPGTTEDITVFTSLTIVDLQLHDVARYSCNASNDLFEPRFNVSDEAELTVLYPPNVDVSPKSFVVNQTQPVNFTCTVFGIPPPNLTWYDSSNLSKPLIATEETFFVERSFVNGSNLLLVESVLVFTRALRTDMSSYTCIAVNNIPNILQTPESRTAILYVQVPAEITADPIIGIEHFRGGTTNISCSAQGLPLPTVTWYKDEEVLTLTDRVFVVEETSISDLEGNITSTLVFGVVELADNGSYYCIANNTGAPGNQFIVQSGSSFLFVTHPPNVTLTPPDQLTVNVTFDATLVCFVFAIPLPEITWIRDSDQSIVEEELDRVSITQEDGIHNRTSTLFFSNTLKSDESSYTCVAVNNISNVIGTPENRTVDLIIQVPANVTLITTSPTTGVVAESVLLEFQITQDDPLVQVKNIHWEFQTFNGEIKDITELSTTDQHYELSTDRLSLRIIQLSSAAHAGRYTLFATNEAGTRSNSIDLFIEGPPTLFIRPTAQTVLETDQVLFQCLAAGNPIPTVTWTFKGENITDGGRFTIGTSGPLFGSLMIRNIMFEDEGLYTCLFSNTHGSIEVSTQLTVQVRPRFTDITVPENGIAGGSVTMTCNSTGVPAPSITWLKDNVQVSESMGENVISSIKSKLSSGIMSVTSSLRLLGLVLNDTGSYSCRADNDLARPQTEFSEEQNLTVLYPPSVSINRVALTVNQTDPSSFTCEAFGIPVPSFEWSFNGSIDPLSRGSQIMNVIMTNSSGLDIQVSTLTIQDSIRSLHEGRYTCKASNRILNLIGTPESAEAFLTVQVPPLVLVETEEPLGVVNRSVTISFTVEEASPAVSLQNIQWRFNDSISLNNGTQSVQLGHVFSSDLLSLTINNVQHIDQGFYSLTATNEAGTNFSEVFLEVEAAPLITVPPEDALQLEGNDAIFECLAVSEPQYIVRWQFNGSFINTSSEKFSIDESSGQLSIRTVTLNDTGEYTCFVENIHGNDSASAVLTVQAVPQFRVNPIARSIQLIGESIELNCSSFAVPPANITWLKDGRLLDVSDSSVGVSSSIEDSITLSQLSLNNLGFADTGLYSCKATNDLVSEQSTNSTDAEIIVNMPVILLDSPSDSVVNETDAVEFSCVAEGLPAPLFTWSTPQQANLSLEDFVQISNTVNPSAGATRVESVLRFPSIEDSSANNYTCTANNTPREREESVSASFNIIVQTRPEVMFTGNGTVIGVQFRDTQMTFTVTRDLPKVTQVGIRWFFTQQGVNTRREIVPGDQPDHYVFSNDRLTLSIMLLNLSDSGTYTVEASNIVGTGSALANLNVQRAPVIIIPLVSLTQLSGTNATFTCEAEADPQHTIEWTKEGEELFNSSKYLITGLGTARSTLKIINLELSDTGNYSCFAENLHGNDSTSDQLFVQVPPSFTEFPIASNLTAGDSVTIICNATGFPQPKVELLINGQQDASLTYETSTGSFTDGILYQSVSLFLSDLTFANTAEYSCRASNELASVENRTSPSADFTVQYAPNVSVTPSNIVVNESDAIVLTCKVFAIPIPNIVWSNSSSPQDDLVAPTDLGNIVISFDHSPHPSGFPFTVSNLSISSVLKVHEANYSCLASNGIENLLGTPENGSVSVVVQVPPTVIAEKSSVLGVVGQSVTLTFRIERASPEVELSNIHWTFTSSQSNSAQDITMSSNSRLSFSEDLLLLNVSDIVDNVEGTYTLTASNPAGVSNDSVILNVEATPVFVEVPSNLSRLQGENALFRCSATSEPQYSIRWEKDGITIAEYLSPDDRLESIQSFTRLNTSSRGVNVTEDDSKYILERDGPLLGQLTVLNTMLNDVGLYACIIANFHGSITASATLTVQVAPTFPGKNFTSVNASAGQDLVLECATESSPPPNITWYKDGIEIIETNTIRINESSPSFERVNSFLTLVDITREADGVYWCNATNFLFVLFEAMAPTTTITVFYPPNVIQSPTELQRQAAEYAVFTCVITAFPVPIIQWTGSHTNDPIAERRGKLEIRNTLDDSSVTGPFSVETRLTILNLTFTDQQTYTCTGLSQVDVQNFINATSSASADLFVSVPPRVSAVERSPSIALWGKNFAIKFSISGDRPKVVLEDIIWKFKSSVNGKTEVINANSRLNFSDDRETLEINSVQLTDAGTYSFTASNSAGSSSASIAINVLVEPIIDGITQSYEGQVPTGSTTTLTCRAVGIPLPTLRWLRNGTVATTTGRTIVSTIIGPNLHSQVPTTESVVSNLTVNGIKDSDDYTQWTCIVESSVGSDQESYILRVEPKPADACSSNPCQNNATCYASTELPSTFLCICTGGYTGTRCDILAIGDRIVPPTILIFPQPISDQLRSFVNLTCNAEGNPQPSIEWYKDNVIVSEARMFQYTFELDLSARGWYQCRAVSRLQDGSTLTTSSPPVLVTINNVAQYLMTARVNNLNNSQSIESYVKGIDSEVKGQSLGNNSVVFSVSFHETYNESSESNSTFSAIVTVVSNIPNQQELLDLLVSLELNPPFTLISLVRFDGCVTEMTSFDSNVSWPETNLGTTVELNCPCGGLVLGEGRPVAERMCAGSFLTGAVWNSPSDSVCNFDEQTQGFCSVPELPTVGARVQRLQDLLASSNMPELSPLDLLVIVSILESLSLEEIVNDVNMTQEFLNIIEIVISNGESLQQAQRQFFLSSRILRLIDGFGSLIPVSINGTALFSRNSFIVAAESINSISSFSGTTFTGEFSDIQATTPETASPINLPDASILIPQTLFYDRNYGANLSRLVFSMYPDNSSLFQVSSGTLISTVIAATIPAISINGLSENDSIVITFNSDKSLENTECVFWNFDQNDWDSRGCSLRENDENSVTCICSHLTHFALISVPPVASLPKEEFADVLNALKYVSVSFAALSMICFIILFLTYSISRKQQMDPYSKLFTNISASMILLYAVYIGAVYGTESEVSCIAFSGLFHYAILVVLFSLLGNAVLFLKFKNNSYSVKIISWVIPLLFVGFLLALFKSQYNSDDFCHPSGLLFHIALVLPFAVILTAELILLIGKLVILSKEGLITDSEKSPAILKLFVLVLLFGFGWTFGLVEMETDGVVQVVFKSLFLLFGSMLGIYALMIYGILCKAVRSTWRSWLSCQQEEYDLADLDQKIKNLNNGTNQMNGKHKPILEFKEMHYGPEADFRSPTISPANELGPENEVEDTFNETQEKTVELGDSNSQSSLSSHSSMGYPVPKSPNSSDKCIGMEQTDQTQYDTVSIDQPDSDEETAL